MLLLHELGLCLRDLEERDNLGHLGLIFMALCRRLEIRKHRLMPQRAARCQRASLVRVAVTRRSSFSAKVARRRPILRLSRSAGSRLEGSTFFRRPTFARTNTHPLH